MNSKVFIITFFLLSLSILTRSQRPPVADINIKGKIVQQENNQPLPYVSIGVLNKSLGTLTDTLGNFSFQVGRENLTDTLKISLIGYLSKKITVKDFLESKEKTIGLNIKFTELAEVEITSGKSGTETIGRQGNGKLIQVSIHNKKSVEETIGSEMGMRYKTKQASATLKDFNFYISGNNFNYIKYRINIYSVKDNMPDTLIYNRQIFMTIDNFKTGWIKVDLMPLNIKVKHDFIVTVQWVESKMERKESPITMIPVAMTIFSKNCYARIASQDKWKTVGMNLSNFVTLAY
jgi:hypothetical protein